MNIPAAPLTPQIAYEPTAEDLAFKSWVDNILPTVVNAFTSKGFPDLIREYRKEKARAAGKVQVDADVSALFESPRTSFRRRMRNDFLWLTGQWNNTVLSSRTDKIGLDIYSSRVATSMANFKVFDVALQVWDSCEAFGSLRKGDPSVGVLLSKYIQHLFLAAFIRSALGGNIGSVIDMLIHDCLEMFLEHLADHSVPKNSIWFEERIRELRGEIGLRRALAMKVPDGLKGVEGKKAKRLQVAELFKDDPEILIQYGVDSYVSCFEDKRKQWDVQGFITKHDYTLRTINTVEKFLEFPIHQLTYVYPVALNFMIELGAPKRLIWLYHTTMEELRDEIERSRLLCVGCRVIVE